jgi:microcystin-dependent protein
MSDPYLGEIRIVSFAFPPKGWALCNGQLLPINQNQALFSILGVQYGGDGVTTFALPDFRSRVPVHQSQQFPVGTSGGEETHVLTAAELPAHRHQVRASAAAGTATVPTNAYPAAAPGAAYAAAANTPMLGTAVTSVGGGQPHENRPPFLTLNLTIALQGIYPSRN